MRNFRFGALGAVVAFAAATLAACGGGGGSSGGDATVRVVNATLTHASINLLANSDSVVTATAIDTASAYVSVPSGSPSLQVNDATTGAVLSISAPTVSKGQRFALVAYETGGAVRTSAISEDTAAPTSGTSSVRIFNAATDAGAIDVYITDPSIDITTLSSPTFTFGSSSSVQSTNFASFGPATYRIRVTGAGSPGDLRLDIPSVVLTNQQVATVILTPTAGGTLANGSVLIQESTTYAVTRNTSARLRLVAAVSGGASVSASAGTTSIGNGVVSPAIGTYVSVTSGTPINISVNGGTVAAPATPIAAGSDATLLVYGNAGSATASLITDDNHLPTATNNYKLRLINGITGTAVPLSLDVNFANIASNVPPGTASAYTTIASSTTTSLSVTSPSSLTPIFPTTAGATFSIPGSAVFTLFMLGDSSAPIGRLVKDR